MKGNILMGIEKVMVFILIKTVIYILEIGKKIKKMVKEFLSLKKKENMKDNFQKVKEMDMVFFIIKMEIYILVNGKMVKKAEKEFINLLILRKNQMVLLKRVILLKGNGI